jgi:2-polyprenyl-3-methyl-5-hydroxy-6-metoxy-1,4-benzoquinol methylase
VGYLKEKYKKEYFLKKDADGNTTTFGVAGIEEYQLGTIRYADNDILERIAFAGKTVLDIGCGRGEAVKYAYERGAETVLGVDFSEDAISIATEFINKHDVKAELYYMDALGFINEYSSLITSGHRKLIDIVLMLDSVEHIPRLELTELLNVLRSVMSHRGLIAVNTPHFGIDNDVIVEGLKDLAWDGTEAQDSTAGMHCNRYTRYSFRSYMRKLGYSAISHHLFVVNFQSIPFCALRWAREKAYNTGYPILLPQAHRPEVYEGYSWRTHPFMRPIRWLYRRWNRLTLFE